MARRGHGGRRFTIADGMVLIAAAGVGLVWSRNIWLAFQASSTQKNTWDEALIVVGALALPCLILATLALPLLRMRQPRPRWRRVAQQPGMTATLTASLVLVASAIFITGGLAYVEYTVGLPKEVRRNVSGALVEFLIMIPPFAGLCVMVSWLLLLVQGRWRAEPSWIDRAGRLLGVLWIVAMAVAGTFWVKQLS